MEGVFMNLRQIFQNRFKHAIQMLKNPEAGPKRILFSSSDLSNAATLERLHDQFPHKKRGAFYLYRLSLEDKHEAIASNVRKAFRGARKNGGRNMSRDNESHPVSTSLYVGTSGNMHHRFRNHLGIGHGKATWALYLSAWAVPLKAEFVVEYFEFKETTAEDIELIEGVLWDSLLPLFGKKGGK
jgi:hypothetical protein